MFIAEDIDQFRALFVRRLRDMLDSGELGAFILVLANSMQDAATRAQLEARLKQVFEQHRDAYQAGELQAAPDDIQVFEQLLKTGIDDYGVWRVSRKHPWLQFFNPLRALRPARASAEVIDNIRKPFDDKAFNFNKPFLRAERLWQGELQGEDGFVFECTVLYNKFPFLPYHFILAPNAADCFQQYLHQEFHELVWSLCEQHADILPGLGFGYNSIGACASVNHLHFQGFIYSSALPVELSQWRHNGGDVQYPMQCAVFDDIDSAWQAIRLLHLLNQPYNLLYRPSCCYVLSRKMQGSPEVYSRVAGAGWIEACGVFSEADELAIEKLTADNLRAEIHSLSANPQTDAVR